MSDSERIVSFNIQAAKSKIQDASSKAFAATRGRIEKAGESIKGRVSGGRDKALSAVIDRGIALTRRQLSALEGIKAKRNKKAD